MSERFPTFRKIWSVWKRIAARIAEVQANILLTLIYILVLVPIGILQRLFRKDPLFLLLQRRPSYWSERQPLPSIDEFLKRQF